MSVSCFYMVRAYTRKKGDLQFNKTSQKDKTHFLGRQKGKKKDETCLGSTMREKHCPFMKYGFPCLSCGMVC